MDFTRQKFVYKNWVEDIIEEGEPIPVSKSYNKTAAVQEANAKHQTKSSAPVAAKPVAAALLSSPLMDVDDDSDSEKGKRTPAPKKTPTAASNAASQKVSPPAVRAHDTSPKPNSHSVPSHIPLSSARTRESDNSTSKSKETQSAPSKSQAKSPSSSSKHDTEAPKAKKLKETHKDKLEASGERKNRTKKPREEEEAYQSDSTVLNGDEEAPKQKRKSKSKSLETTELADSVLELKPEIYEEDGTTNHNDEEQPKKKKKRKEKHSSGLGESEEEEKRPKKKPTTEPERKRPIRIKAPPKSVLMDVSDESDEYEPPARSRVKSKVAASVSSAASDEEKPVLRSPKSTGSRKPAPSKKIRIYVSQSSSENLSKVEKVVRDLQARGESIEIVDSVLYATHLVTYFNHSAEPNKASINLLLAISRGIWILLPSWIEEAWRTKGIPDPGDHELRYFEGPRSSRRAHRKKSKYLSRIGMDEKEAIKLTDRNLIPKVLFTGWSFNLDFWKHRESLDDLKHIIINLGGAVTPKFQADIWFTSTQAPVTELDFSPPRPIDSDDERELQSLDNPLKSQFENANTKTRMPTYAFELAWLRDSILKYEPQPRDKYTNYYERSTAVLPKKHTSIKY